MQYDKYHNYYFKKELGLTKITAFDGPVANTERSIVMWAFVWVTIYGLNYCKAKFVLQMQLGCFKK